MKGLSRSLWLVGIVLLSFVLLSACDTSSKDQAADGAVPGVYKNVEQGFTSDLVKAKTVARHGNCIFR